jgi:hypothetical protein
MKRLIDWFKGRGLRNKVGGMSWVLRSELHSGAESLAGSAVKTVAKRPNGMWRIEPVLGYVATHRQSFPDGTVYEPGEMILVDGLADSVLEPWKDAGITESEVRELYEPRITTKETTS